jgi:transcriptional regulator with XRE-family HTH domain
MKRNYEPTEADRLTGANMRDLRKRRGETLAETTDRSGFGRDRSTLAATERGERRLTEIEATKLAAHFGTTADKIIVTPKRPALLPVARTEQEYLGNTTPDLPAALFAVPGPDRTDVAAFDANFITIDRDAPLTPEQYRAQVWIPYLEARYNTDQKAS